MHLTPVAQFVVAGSWWNIHARCWSFAIGSRTTRRALARDWPEKRRQRPGPATGIGTGSYHTAWNLLHKLRRAMVRPGRERLQGIVEVDEIFIGGPRPGKRGRGGRGEVLVVVAAQQAAKGIGRIRRHRDRQPGTDGRLEGLERAGSGIFPKTHSLGQRDKS
jgi:hypothetical protein